MKFGASMFFTDYSMGPAELAVALEERGFDIVWAPEHSHIPTSRKSSFILGSELPKRYYDVMDPFVTLSVAAAVTTAPSSCCLWADREAHRQRVQVEAAIPLMSAHHRKRTSPCSSILAGG